jgi:hypothetical protein
VGKERGKKEELKEMHHRHEMREREAAHAREADREMLTVDCRIKVRLDLQEDKSSVVVKGPFFP